LKDNGLTDCHFAKEKIEKAKKGDQNDILKPHEKEKLMLCSKITANFIKISDMYFMNEKEYPVDAILSTLVEMSTDLGRLK